MRTHCSLCGHPTRRRRIVDRYLWREKYLVLITGVPAEVCTFCGEAYVHGDVARRCDEIAQPIITAARHPAPGPLAVVPFVNVPAKPRRPNKELVVRERRLSYRAKPRAK